MRRLVIRVIKCIMAQPSLSSASHLSLVYKGVLSVFIFSKSRRSYRPVLNTDQGVQTVRKSQGVPYTVPKGANESKRYSFVRWAHLDSFLMSVLTCPKGPFHLNLEVELMSVQDETRKMVIYSCQGRSQEKFWWKLVTVLTCKLLVWSVCRGERPIEPSS